MSLTFRALRAANLDRLPQFRDAKGRLSHSRPDGFDWPLSQWANAVCGELGEAANLIKKIERGDFTLEEARESLADELADIVTYLDLLANRAGVDLGAATVSKFNRVSKRVKATSRLPCKGMVYLASPHSHPDASVREQRFRDVCAAAARLFDAGEWVYCPIAHTHVIASYMHDAMKWEAWAEYDRFMLSLCDKLVVLKLDGYMQSRGVAAELEIANKLGLPVEFMPWPLPETLTTAEPQKHESAKG